MPPAYPRLFAPLALGPLTLANRIMMTATSNALARDRLPSAAQAAFYAARAAGGVGVVVSEGLRVHATNCNASSIGMFEPGVVAGLRAIGERVHAHGVPIIGQIMHGGRQTHRALPHLLWAPSAVACPYSGYVPHAMTAGEVEEMREAFVTAALRVQDAGWDGIELHAAQGHLVQQFLSPLSNRRTDRYGGDAERRLTFAREVLGAIAARCGAGFVIGLRLAATELVPGGLGIDDAIGIARALAARTRIDYLSLSASNFMRIAGHIPDRREPPHPYAEHALRVRRALPGVPMVVSGRIRTPEEAEAMLAHEAGDLVGLTRPLIADPDWARKARDGEAHWIRRCVYCNVCWHGITQQGGIVCIQNPASGREAALPAITRADQPRHVLVVGGGPAGLAAAEAAAERGHRVTLIEREPVLGGQVRWAARVPGDAEIGHVVAHLEARVRALGVDVRTEREAGVDDILAARPDAVIVATGSVAANAPIAGLRDVPVLGPLAVIDALAERETLPWRRVLIVDRDGYFATFAIAELLAARGAAVSIVTWHMHVGRDLPATNLTEILGRLDAAGVDLLPAHEVVGGDRGAVTLRHVYSARERGIGHVDAIVVVGDQRALGALADALRVAAPALAVHVVGDALAPRAIRDAIDEGHRAGRGV